MVYWIHVEVELVLFLFLNVSYLLLVTYLLPSIYCYLHLLAPATTIQMNILQLRTTTSMCTTRYTVYCATFTV